MEAGLGPTATAWGQLQPLGAPGNPSLDFAALGPVASGPLELDSAHWGPIIYSQEASSMP